MMLTAQEQIGAMVDQRRSCVAPDALDDKLEGLRAGVDDYMTKPFAFEELLARLDVLRLHAAGNRPASDEIVVGDICIDLSLKTAQRSGLELNLTATEFALLRRFAANAGRVISKTDLLRTVRGSGYLLASDL
ncbi:response regulator transcription factor [Marivita sp. S0852]|uniref:response regulator transcription factor n=1 Tax=Marivita sp. S0852 TaxID=3373893 RepID=UPI003981E7BD